MSVAVNYLLRLLPRLICRQVRCLHITTGCCGQLLTPAAGIKLEETRTNNRKRKNSHKPVAFHNADLTWEERLACAVTPLWRLSYEEQLQVKYEAQMDALRILTANLAQFTEQFPAAAQGDNDICCPLWPTLPSPVTVGYRNKSTFSVNRGPDGNPKTVGHYIGTGRGRSIICVQSDRLINMSEKHKQVARIVTAEGALQFSRYRNCHVIKHAVAQISYLGFNGSYEQFIRQSPLGPCLLFHKGGHWREITVRTNRRGDTMAIVYFHPQSLTKEEISKHQESLVNYFTVGLGASCELTSLYFQESAMSRCDHEQSPYQLLYGAPQIFEEVLGLMFRISPDAFFQVNSMGAEVLYQTVRELISTDSVSTLLDICCGTGAIGLTLSREAAQVIGIELIPQAVEDARYNATLNGIGNCEFLCGKAEAILPELLPSLEAGDPITAVVNPARSGLHYRVVRAIRNCPAIRRLVYISCKPEGEAMRNFVELCCPPDQHKKLYGDPFTPKLAVPMDMFPHTSHCELVLLLER